MKPAIGQVQLRKGRHSCLNHIYHVTFSTLQRQPVFLDFHRASLLRRILKSSDENNHSQTYAFCIMPDHIHWLFQLKQGDLSQSISRVKGQYSQKSESKIWQRGFFDHAIRKEESLIQVARYIVANPLRTGLVESVGMYSHWDSNWL